MNPYLVLGLERTATKKQAKVAYRKLAMIHHPDRGGDKARFQEIQAAWAWIESDKPVPPETPEPAVEKTYTSSFTDPQGRTRPPPRPSPGFQSDRPTQTRAGKPAPGYEAKGPPKLPKTKTHGRDHSVVLEVTPQQAALGCMVPFLHTDYGRPSKLEHWVAPGSGPYTVYCRFVTDEMIGSQAHSVGIHVTVKIITPNTHEFMHESELNEKPTGNMKVTLRVSALALFTGGLLETKDYLGETVPVVMPPGYDPSKPLVVNNKGYGPKNNRGDLYVHVEPVFKDPSKLTTSDKTLLTRLYEQVNR